MNAQSMEFVCGAIHPHTAKRYVFAGKAMPTISQLVYLADAVEPTICDWGESADPEALKVLANLVCLHMGWKDATVAQRLCRAFATQLTSGKMWLMQKHELAGWAAGEHIN